MTYTVSGGTLNPTQPTNQPMCRRTIQVCFRGGGTSGIGGHGPTLFKSSHFGSLTFCLRIHQNTLFWGRKIQNTAPHSFLQPSTWPPLLNTFRRHSFVLQSFLRVTRLSQIYKIPKFVAIRCVLSSWKCTKTVFDDRAPLLTLLGAYNAPPGPLVGWGGDIPSPFPPLGVFFRLL